MNLLICKMKINFFNNFFVIKKKLFFMCEKFVLVHICENYLYILNN